ncbi:hypothetical protein E4T50_14767 [Aureobasidium sp. EXF-12298]|nr:hypothetical protein E4T50_14767 [Aureobasidium sp. EXF-12298]KAI4752782.1 hypothetical protein E4T51_14054 [Aureobasidium sp. EXF-12344]KAI4778217.1 hypothetical protein E4T52_06849 [Aureobasidium sp. EXF-3400]
MLDSILTHWRALCILYGSLLASIAFAVGHHLHNQKLNNTVVSTTNDLAIGTWTGVSSQNFNTAIGNTLASLFRTFLSITVTTAYCQIVWHALKARSTRLNIVDAISGILANPVGFLNLGAWRKSALLFPLAIAIWLLPIAPIITPATLTVATDPQTSHNMVNVSSIDFNSLNFASIDFGFGDPCEYRYTGPQHEVQKVVTGAAAPGAVLSIPAPNDQRNASYVQHFAAPALQCSDVTDPVRGEIISNVNASSWINMGSYGFLAWVPNNTYSLPFVLGNQEDESGAASLRQDTIGPTGGEPLTLFVATFPNYINPSRPAGMDAHWNYTADATVIKCSLMNATYSLSFSWTNSIQDLNVTVDLSQNGMSYPDTVLCTDYLFTNDSQGEDAPHASAQPLTDFNNRLVQKFAYASVMDAFTKLFGGSIPVSGSGTSTNVLNTVLGDTAELLALQKATANNTDPGLQGLPPEYWPGVSVSEQGNDAPKLLPTLELLFRNATLRLMTSPLLQPDPRTPFFPPPVNVTTTVYRNVYAYSAAVLLLAYGTALLIAIVTVVAGSLAIFSSGVSYSSSFSTVLRTTSHALVSTEISRDDASGQDPLPKHLAQATIRFDHDEGLKEEASKQLLEPKGGFELGSVSSRSERNATW